ncbi:hypothetical protein Tco_0004549 [Tanacetum coccineum]
MKTLLVLRYQTPKKTKNVVLSAFVPASKRHPKPLTLKRLNVSSDTLKLFDILVSRNNRSCLLSTTEAEYVSAGKACQQALWMKQDLIDCDVRLDDVSIMCDNQGEMTLEDELRYTKSYVLTISNENYNPDILKPIIRNLECRSIHEGRPVSPESTKYDNIQNLFQIIKLLNIYELHKGICPRFLLEFYSSIEITKDNDQNVFLTF